MLGGFAEGKSHLNDIADVAKEIDDIDKSHVLSLPQAMDHSELVASKTRESLVIADSMGIINIYPHMRPNEVISFNGPEPMKSIHLGRAIIRTFKVHKQNLVDAEHLGTIFGHGAEFFLHPIDHMRKIPEVLEFSSAKRLRELLVGGAAVRQVRYIDDEIFSPDFEKLIKTRKAGAVVKLAAGCHHSLGLDPLELHRAYGNGSLSIEDIETMAS